MPDNIERTIYKLEMDNSQFIESVDKLSASTNRLTQSQASANKTLEQNEATLKANSDQLQKAKKDLDDYIGTNERYRKQLQDSVKSAVSEQTKLTEIVNSNRKAYEAATKAAQDFATTSSKAAAVQARTPNGKLGIPLSVPGGITAQISGAINTVEFADNIQIIEQTKQEFEALATAIDLAETRMRQLNSEDEEFKSLAIIVEQGRTVLKQYDEAAKLAANSTGSLKSQVSAATTELNRMEVSGRATTKQLLEQEKLIVSLKRAYSDQTERIRVLSSQTRGLDFGKASIQTAISGFQTYASISILAGGASEGLQKKTLQLFAAMQLLTSLEVLAKTVRKESIIVIGVQTAAQAVYTAVVGASTGALKAFRIALLATGIGAAIVLIGFLISKLSGLKSATKEAADNQKLLNEVVAEGNKEAGKQIADLKILYQAATNVNLSMKDRLKAVKDLQQEFPDFFGNIKTETILNGDAKKSYDELSLSIIASSRARAAKAKIDIIEDQRLDNEFEKEKIKKESRKQKKGARDEDVANIGGVKSEFADPTITITRQQKIDLIEERKLAKLQDIQDKDDKLKRQEDFLIKFVGLDKLVPDPKKETEKKTAATKTAIQNDFDERKAALLAQISALAASEFETKIKIEKEFADKLVKARLDIQKLKSVTPAQKEELLRLAGILNAAELAKALGEFNKKLIDARKKLNAELKELEDKNTQDNIDLIQDEFDRRAKLIDFNEKKQIEDSKENTQKRLDDLKIQYAVGLITEQDYQDAKERIIYAAELNINNIIIKSANERQDSAADLFQKSLDGFQSIVDAANLSTDEDQAKKIRQQSDRFLAGKITFEQFQKELTKIQKKGESDRRNSDLVDERTALAVLEDKIAKTEDKTSEHYKKLIKQRGAFRKKIAADEKEDAIKDAGEGNTDPRTDKIAKYAEAIGAVADSVIQFWAKANEAETKALDYSISLQEKRVEAAQRIASRGNAQYLKQEEDRLKELNVKRENAARKQLGIDAALQASQILVAITGAIAKIANPVPGAGIAETIAAVAIIIGSLATGYGLVKSLQGNQPKLAKGKKYVTRDGHRSGVDTIPAWLNEGEAVIPTDRNRAYHPTVAAIYDGTIPADHMNSFVNAYHKVKGVPMPNYNRIGEAAGMSISADGKMAILLSDNNKKLDESNELSRQTLRAMKSMNVSANIDRDGVAIMVNEYIGKMEIDKRV